MTGWGNWRSAAWRFRKLEILRDPRTLALGQARIREQLAAKRRRHRAIAAPVFGDRALVARTPVVHGAVDEEHVVRHRERTRDAREIARERVARVRAEPARKLARRLRARRAEVVGVEPGRDDVRVRRAGALADACDLEL